MKIGIDLIDMAKLPQEPGERQSFFERLLSPEERAGSNLESMCGKVAVKEALIKVGLLSPGEWLNVKVLHGKHGEPYLKFEALPDQPATSISISHTENLVIAVVLYQ